MAPEQVQGHFAAHSEIYSLGVILHELLTLDHYLTGMTSLSKTLIAIMKRPVPTAMDISQPIQGETLQVVPLHKRLCKEKFEERFSTVIMMRRGSTA